MYVSVHLLISLLTHIDVDECASSALNNCTQLCSNTYGGFQCLCDSGYLLQGPDVCTGKAMPRMFSVLQYSGPSLTGHSLERTPLYKGHKFLAASTMNVRNAPSHQRTPL